MNTEYNNEQINEGVKEVIMTLIAGLAIGGAGVHALSKKVESMPESPEEKVEAITKVKDKYPKFDKALRDIVDDLNVRMDDKIKQGENAVVGAITPKSKPVLVKPKYDDITIQASEYIIPNEIIGRDIFAKENKQFLVPHKDSSGLWTIGIGHLMGDGSDAGKEQFIKQYGKPLTDNMPLSPKQVIDLFKQDLPKKINGAKKKFGYQWDEFSTEMKLALIDINYRGGLYKKNSKEEFKFVNAIKHKKFKKAAELYLDDNEYRTSIKKAPGVRTRMERNAKIIANEKSIK